MIWFLSYAGIACSVANKVNAKCLILNHFSQRYKPIGYVSEKVEGDDEPEANVQKLFDEARSEYKGELYAAYDLFSYKFWFFTPFEIWNNKI